MSSGYRHPPDDPIAQPTNRGNKLRANAKYVSEGAMGYIHGEDLYKEVRAIDLSPLIAGFSRSRNPSAVAILSTSETKLTPELFLLRLNRKLNMPATRVIFSSEIQYATILKVKSWKRMTKIPRPMQRPLKKTHSRELRLRVSGLLLSIVGNTDSCLFSRPALSPETPLRAPHPPLALPPVHLPGSRANGNGCRSQAPRGTCLALACQKPTPTIPW